MFSWRTEKQSLCVTFSSQGRHKNYMNKGDNSNRLSIDVSLQFSLWKLSHCDIWNCLWPKGTILRIMWQWHNRQVQLMSHVLESFLNCLNCVAEHEKYCSTLWLYLIEPSKFLFLQEIAITRVKINQINTAENMCMSAIYLVFLYSLTEIPFNSSLG
jgi:hypothetical protein